MQPFQQAHYDVLPQWEGKVPWLYLDSHQPNPIPTVGIGCALTGLGESLGLGWTVGGVPATAAEIEADWRRVALLPGNRVASFYPVPGCPELPEVAIAALVAKRYDVFTAQLQVLFPDFDAWPIPAQTGALDLIFCVGLGGIQRYAHFLEAARERNWPGCALQCAANAGQPAFARRNAWRAGLFTQAAA